MSIEEFSPIETSAMDSMRKGEAMDLPDEPESQDTITAPRAETPAPVADPEPKADKPPEGHVPHGALHEERERRKAAETQLAEFKARIEALEKSAKPAEPEKPKRPDPILEPEAFGEWLETQLAEARKPAVEITEQQQKAYAARQRLETASRLEQQFAATTPDYMAAVTQLKGQREAELRAMGWAEEQVAQIIATDANAIFDNATRLGKNPAELLYEQAKLRGWKAQAAAPVVADAERIAAQARAMENVATLSTASGEAQEGGLTMKQLAEMDENELAELKKKDPKKFAKAMGA